MVNKLNHIKLVFEWDASILCSFFFCLFFFLDLDFIYLFIYLFILFWVVAVHYKLKRLTQMCEVFIRDHVSIENVLTLLIAANRLGENEIERFLLGFMRDVQRFEEGKKKEEERRKTFFFFFFFFFLTNRYTQVIKQTQATEIAQDNKGKE